MRKVLACMLGLGMLVGLAAPASAGKPVKTSYDSLSVNAFWYTTEQLSPNTYETTTKYVGAYVTGTDRFSDYYEDTTRCRTSRRGETCETVSSKWGYSDNFTLTGDAENLTVADLDGDYLLEVFSGRTSSTESVHVSAHVEGIGTLEASSGWYSFHSKCFSSRTRFDDAWRQGEATGSVNGVDLGETYDAFLSRSSATSVDRSCE